MSKAGSVQLADRDRLIVVGKTGSGKSSFCKVLIEQLAAEGRRIVWIDYCDEYSADAPASERVTRGPLRDRLTWDKLMEDESVLAAPDLSLAVVPSRDPRECAEQVGELIEVIEGEGDLILGMDEVGMFSAHCVDRLHYLAAQSRHWGVPVVMASQSMIDIPARARRQGTQLVSFLQSHPADLDAIGELTGDKAFAARVARLRVGEHEHWRDQPTEPPRRKRS